jgi:hypothetical protein
MSFPLAPEDLIDMIYERVRGMNTAELVAFWRKNFDDVDVRESQTGTGCVAVFEIAV